MFPNDWSHSLKHLTLRLELGSNGFLYSRCFLLALKNLEMHLMDDVMYGNIKVVIFEQFDNTLSRVDVFLVLDEVIHGTEDMLKPVMDFH